MCVLCYCLFRFLIKRNVYYFIFVGSDNWFVDVSVVCIMFYNYLCVLLLLLFKGFVCACLYVVLSGLCVLLCFVLNQGV